MVALLGSMAQPVSRFTAAWQSLIAPASGDKVNNNTEGGLSTLDGIVMKAGHFILRTAPCFSQACRSS